ncbi:uncharacterized protein STEHIDRAFT_79173 [Stereum hirsutum FP-91666 SS1]|uniref:uncharacterized protein n=1 Tax=Stereum hirsutum (strain FP-91666) TaxID=721885 RepID=UPI000440FC82|nr:uncharacterized protein STEHIDRAFT_79173 [Stereum hirsutum FP-91666 SS1]EIM86636.1 hypothetical protein STEHIDRAFT_79173 [Stereum hirsutum FP-91666 SS1]
MQAVQTAQMASASQPPPVKIYNAVYSSVQVYECMVRGIAVMRRRADSYVNATQILKVAGVDKGRRTKILEKEILPGKHEIVQGGYGKYQGTWIPLERGRDISAQYGVAHLLAPLFDFVPSSASLGGLPAQLSGTGGMGQRPLSASSSFSSLGDPAGFLPSALPSAPILPGSALRLLNQGRAQGLFTPSSSSHHQPNLVYSSPSNNLTQGPQLSQYSTSTPSTPPVQSLKRTRSEVVGNTPTPQATLHSLMSSHSVPDLAPTLAASPSIQTPDVPRPLSAVPVPQSNDDNPSPTKRARTEPPHLTYLQEFLPQLQDGQSQYMDTQSQAIPTQPNSRAPSVAPPPLSQSNGLDRSDTQSLSGSQPMPQSNGTMAPPSSSFRVERQCRFATKPSINRHMDLTAPLKDLRRNTLVTTICQRDDPARALEILREIPPDNPGAPPTVDYVLDDLGHTALHIAASMGRQRTVETLIANGADIHRGNYNGETPLIRACLASDNFEQQSFTTLVTSLHESIWTLDTSRKSVLHHIVALAGVKNRAIVARYYLDTIFVWIAQQEGGDFRSIVDLQDEHGDTALNVAARVGNRSIVRTMLDVGANRILPNKLGLRPGDFGVENEELGGGPRVEDLIASLRSGPSAPVQKSQDVIADMTSMIQSLSSEFSAEVKVKQDQLDVTQAHLRAATRELSEQRKQIQAWQARCGELDQINQRIRNVEKALKDEDSFDWTGRTDLAGNDAKATAGPAFMRRGANSTMVGLGGLVDVSFNLETDPTIPLSDSVASLVRLKRMQMWQVRMEELVAERMKNLKGTSAEKEFQCKKIVALCTGVPIDKVEEMLDDLVIAMESEAHVADIGRVSGFMQKVRDSVI